MYLISFFWSLIELYKIRKMKVDILTAIKEETPPNEFPTNDLEPKIITLKFWDIFKKLDTYIVIYKII